MTNPELSHLGNLRSVTAQIIDDRPHHFQSVWHVCGMMIFSILLDTHLFNLKYRCLYNA